MELELKQHIGVQLKKLRKGRHLSQKALGNMSGISYQYIGRIERKEINPRFEMILDLFEVMDYELAIIERRL